MKALEIERKFLLKGIPHPALFGDKVEILGISQWYTKNENGEVERYRITDTGNGYRQEKIIKRKLDDGIAEEEHFSLTDDEFEEELRKIRFNKNWTFISKTRRVYYHNDLKFEVDCFKNMTLTICEVELKKIEDLHKPIDFPQQIKKLIIKEVTNDPEFNNYNLSYTL